MPQLSIWQRMLLDCLGAQTSVMEERTRLYNYQSNAYGPPYQLGQAARARTLRQGAARARTLRTAKVLERLGFIKLFPPTTPAALRAGGGMPAFQLTKLGRRSNRFTNENWAS